MLTANCQQNLTAVGNEYKTVVDDFHFAGRSAFMLNDRILLVVQCNNVGRAKRKQIYEMCQHNISLREFVQINFGMLRSLMGRSAEIVYFSNSSHCPAQPYPSLFPDVSYTPNFLGKETV